MTGAHVGAIVSDNAHVGAIASDNAHVGAPTKLDAVIVRTQAKEALVGLGWKPAIDGRSLGTGRWAVSGAPASAWSACSRRSQAGWRSPEVYSEPSSR